MKFVDEKQTLTQSETRYARIGELNLWVRRRENDWLMNYSHDNVRIRKAPAEPTAIEDMEESTWQRWALHSPSDTLETKPLMPDRAVVVRPIIPLTLHPKTKVVFLVRIPLWISLKVVLKKESYDLAELPTEILSDTWFGTPEDGELCYSVKSPAVRSIDELSRENYYAICPVKIANHSAEKLPILKFNLRVNYLSIYSDQKNYWTNEVTVNFKGANHPTELDYATKAPSMAPKATLVKSSRKKPEKNLLRRTLGSYLHTII